MRTGPIGSLVFVLSDVLSRNVVDKTGLTGNYDFDLKWTRDDQQGTPDAGPTLFTALEEQPGLKLVSAKGPVDTFVVDHVERPTENGSLTSADRGLLHWLGHQFGRFS